MPSRSEKKRCQNKRKWEQAAFLRVELIVYLGGKCALCGSVAKDVGGWRGLHIDHEDGRQWELRESDSLLRVYRYYAELAAGVALRVLCYRCNGWDGARRREELRAAEAGA